MLILLQTPENGYQKNNKLSSESDVTVERHSV